MNGFKKALLDQGVECNQSKIQQIGYAVADGYEMTKNIIERFSKTPEAIFTSAITLLEGLLQYAKEHKPDLFSHTRVITYDDHPMLDYLQPPIFSVRQNAPPGIKGISLFLVPKFLPNESGDFVDRNKVECGSIEKKMGIHASPTCVMGKNLSKG